MDWNRWLRRAAVSAVCVLAVLAGGCGVRQEASGQDPEELQSGTDAEIPGQGGADAEAVQGAGTEGMPVPGADGVPDPGQSATRAEYHVMKVDEAHTYQTMESFGTSGAWWSQYVGGFTEYVNDDGISSREAIAKLLFDREEGIGLNCYRFNLGAGSAESRKGTFSDVHRRAQSFETAAGEYDFGRDENAVWFLRRAVELGVEEVVLFCNSPLERLTDNGLAHMTEGGSRVNIQPENYGAFAVYCMDVAEHFVAEGIPVKYISPINEPQWDWYNGQEGCHYEPDKTAGVYLAFLEELEKRPALEGVKLSGPESGEWGGADTQKYAQAILGEERLAAHFDAIDNHSYWSDAVAKQSFKNWMVVHYPEVKLRTSEWCEMVNGSDVTMDSAIHIAQEIAEDLRILEVVSWQNWVGVAPGGYRDGLIYIDEKSQKYRALKRLWSFGNYSRYVRPGYVRVDIEADTRQQEKMLPTAFTGTNEDGEQELVMVFINEGVTAEEFVLEGCEAYSRMKCYETSDERDLECVLEGEYSPDTVVTIPRLSVVTVVLGK